MQVKNSNVKNGIIIVLVILLITFLFYLFTLKKKVDSKIELYPYISLSSGTYTDNYFGFTLQIPKDKNQYVLREEGNSNCFGENCGVDIYLGVATNTNDQYKTIEALYPEGKSRVLDFERFKIIPVYNWKSDDGLCKDPEGPCIENDVLASSTKYIFSTDYPRPNLDSNDSYNLNQSFNLEKKLKVFEPIKE